MRPRARVQDVALVAMSLHAFAPAQLSAIGCGSLFLFAARPRWALRYPALSTRSTLRAVTLPEYPNQPSVPDSLFVVAARPEPAADVLTGMRAMATSAPRLQAEANGLPSCAPPRVLEITSSASAERQDRCRN